MQHDQAQIKLDKAAIDAGKCPETGTDLTKVDIDNHLAQTFPHADKVEHANTDYGRRARLIKAWADSVGRKIKEAL